MMKYQLFPRRFQVSDLLSPDSEYDNISQNEHIQPASDYNMVERVIGSAWESMTHLRSPIHTKVLGAYSPEEQYRRLMLRGDFASWVTPYDSFIKPYMQGLHGVDDPLQGALSFGMGGALFGGFPGAVLGSAVGAAWGAVSNLTGYNYVPSKFTERDEMQSYFDRLEYERASSMYKTTGLPQWRKEIINNPIGWAEYGGGISFNMDRPKPSIGYMSRHAYQAQNTINSPDRGFRSPYGGQDPEKSLNYDPNINIFSGFAALPPWDRPFWTAFLDTPDEDQNKVLDLVDSQMGKMLKVAWGRGEEVAQPNMDAFFQSYYKPSMLEPMMSPIRNISDYQTVTAQNEGLNAHDFGLGWREQMLRISLSPTNINPIEMGDTASPELFRSNLSNGEITDAIRKVLDRMGYPGSNVLVNTVAGGQDETIIRLNVRRSSASKIIEEYYGSS